MGAPILLLDLMPIIQQKVYPMTAAARAFESSNLVFPAHVNHVILKVCRQSMDDFNEIHYESAP